MKNWWKRFPPYEGEEPYLYFAFADADARRVWPVLRALPWVRNFYTTAAYYVIKI